MQSVLTVGGKKFTRLPRIRTDEGPVTVYKGEHEFLRIGEPRVIESHISLHRRMLECGFPVAAIVDTGVLDTRAYFIETSLGEKSLSDLFYADYTEKSVISEEHFLRLVDITRQYLHAQFRTATSRDVDAFGKGILLDTLCKELPEHETQIRARYASAIARTEPFPYVMTHGDYNPANIHPGGVIDIEDSFSAPIGYDPVTAIVTTEANPLESGYESRARYRYADAQRDAYYAACDDVFAEHDIPKLSGVRDDFAFCRFVWLTARMHARPKLQRYRYDLFIDRYLS